MIPLIPFRTRVVPAIACLISVALCFLYAYYRSELPHWWSQYGGGIPYVLFWILLTFTVLPQRSYIMGITVGVVLMTCGLEFMQLVDVGWLTQFRTTKFGAALLGNTFVWMDIPPYFIGGAIGWVVLFLISSREESTNVSPKDTRVD
jgi:hypothetical protein